MAAVLCKAFGELCSAASHVVCLPCRACNLGCEAIGDVLLSPFFPYLALTFALNLPSVVYGIRAASSLCDFSQWLIGNAIFAAVHMLAATYIVNTIRSSRPIESSAPAKDATSSIEEGKYYSNFWTPHGSNEKGAENSCQRIKHVLCYDKVMAVYILVFIGWLMWLSVGISEKINKNGNGCNAQEHYVTVSLFCGYFYLSMVFFAFGCSLCCLR